MSLKHMSDVLEFGKSSDVFEIYIYHQMTMQERYIAGNLKRQNWSQATACTPSDFPTSISRVVVPHEFASDEPLLGHPETCCVWVTCSCYSARTTSGILCHLGGKARWRQNFFILFRPKDLLFKVVRHVHQIVKFGCIIVKLFSLIEAGPRKKCELVQVHLQHRQAKDCFLSRQQNFSAPLWIFIPKAKS